MKVIGSDIWDCREKHFEQRYSVLKREAIFGVVLLLSAYAKCADPFACLVMSGEWCCQMKEWHSEHDANLSPFSLCLMESELESDTCFFLLRGRWCSGLFNMFKCTNSESLWLLLLTTLSKDVMVMVGFINFMHVYYGLSFWPFPVAAVKSASRSL